MSQPRTPSARATSPGATLVLGAGAAERVELTVSGYTYPASREPYDANWLSAEIEIAAGVFAGRFAANIEAGAFGEFHSSLARLHATLDGEAKFEPMERQLALRLAGNGRGQIALTGEAQHPLGVGNRLTFAFSLDQTQLAGPLRQLERIVAQFPARA